MDGGAWKAAVHRVPEGLTRLSDFTFNFHFPLSCIGEGNGNPLQCSCLENPRDRGSCWAAIYGVAQSRTQLRDFTFIFHFHALEKELATHSQCSCLENPRDAGAWWAAVYGVAQSQTRLNWLSGSRFWVRLLMISLNSIFSHYGKLAIKNLWKCTKTLQILFP